jgi:hypothetical protein
MSSRFTLTLTAGLLLLALPHIVPERTASAAEGSEQSQYVVTVSGMT